MVFHGERLTDDAYLLRVDGELEVLTVAPFERAVEEALDQRADRLVVDLSHTTFMDSVALGALIRYARRLRGEGGLLVVVAGDVGQPATKFDLSGTRHFFHVCASVDEALGVRTARDPGAPSGAAATLRLYVNGRSPYARQAVAAVNELRTTHLPPGSRVDVVDVAERPDVAEDERLLATPLLVRLAPEPVRRIVGDLSDLDEVVEALHLPTRPAPR